MTDAHDGNDLTKVRIRYGSDGYAVYWYCLELIAGDLGADDKITFELRHDAEVIGNNLKIDTVKVEEMMRFMVSLGLFEQSGNVVTCLKLAKYLEKKTTRNITIHKIIDAASCLSATNPDKSGLSPLDTDTDTDTEKKETKASAKPPRFNPGARLTDMGVTETTATDWLTLRKAKRAAVTETALAGIVKEAGKAGITLQAALELCCQRGWQGFEAGWINGKDVKTTPPPAKERPCCWLGCGDRAVGHVSGKGYCGNKGHQEFAFYGGRTI